MATIDGGLLGTFWASGWVGRGVFVCLLAFSLASWTILLAKWLRFSRAAAASKKFLDLFQRSRRFSEVSGPSARFSASPLVGLFQAAHAELDAQVKRNQSDDPSATGSRFRIKSLDPIERALVRATGRETRSLQRHLWLLATTAAATPFIGLFGTVWGIMKAFHAIGETGSTSIVAVAPGIAEALVNTAAGLGAAVPALIGYNLCASRIRELRGEMEDFALDFLALTERNFL